MIRKLIAAGVCLGVFALQAQAVSLANARVTARAGTGITFTSARTPSVNPASAGQADSWFGFELGAGAFVTDPNDAIDDFDDAQDAFDDLKVSCSPSGSQSDCRSDARDLDRGLTGLNNDDVFGQVGADLVIAFPVPHARASFFARGDARVAGDFNYDPTDRANLRQCYMGSSSADCQALQDQVDQDTFRSNAHTSGVGVVDVGVNLARSDRQLFGWQDPVGALDYGVNVKYQQVWLADAKLRVSSDDDLGDTFSKDNNTDDFSQVNFDFGAIQHIEGTPFSVGATLKNLIPYSHTLKVTRQDGTVESLDYKMQPQLTVAGGYDIGWVKAESSIDLIKNRGFERLGSTQFFRLGGEVGLSGIAQLRLGYAHDLRDNEKDVFTAGFGVSPFNVVSLDFAGIIGADSTYGGMFTLGLRI